MKYKLIFGVVCSVAAGFSYATLGESSSSINKDVEVINLNNQNANLSFKAANVNNQTLTHQKNFDVYFFTTPEGTYIKQYVSNDKVFAIKWHGVRIPNLRQLYGSYFVPYTKTKTNNVGLSQHTVNTLDLDAGVSGISGAFSGYAILKTQLPANVYLTDLK